MNYAVILSGGVGTRLGLDLPKQYYKVVDKPIIQFVIELMTRCDEIDGYVIVAADGWQEFIADVVETTVADFEGVGDKCVVRCKGSNEGKFLGFANPGENRQLSIYSGLLALKDIATDDDVILVQDAARPNTSEELIFRCLHLAEDEDGAMPVLPMKDTVYLSKTGKCVDILLNRSEIFAGQAPESFRYGKYLKANEVLLPEKILQINGSTEPAVMAGMKISMIPGEESNLKITTAEDLSRFERIMEESVK